MPHWKIDGPCTLYLALLYHSEETSINEAHTFLPDHPTIATVLGEVANFVFDMGGNMADHAFAKAFGGRMMRVLDHQGMTSRIAVVFSKELDPQKVLFVYRITVINVDVEQLMTVDSGLLSSCCGPRHCMCLRNVFANALKCFCEYPINRVVRNMCLKELPISGSKQLAYYKVSGVLNSFRRQKFVKRFMWAKYGIPKDEIVFGRLWIECEMAHDDSSTNPLNKFGWIDLNERNPDGSWGVHFKEADGTQIKNPDGTFKRPLKSPSDAVAEEIDRSDLPIPNSIDDHPSSSES